MAQEDNNVWENKIVQSSPSAIKQQVGVTNGADIDFKRIISVWPIAILLAILGYIFANIYVRYIDEIYTVAASINIEQKEEIPIGRVLMGSSRDPINDQIAFLKSPNVALELMDSLSLQYAAVSIGKFKNKDLYKKLKWSILPNSDGRPITPIDFIIVPQKNNFEFSVGGIQGKARWGEAFELLGQQIVVWKLGEFGLNSSIKCTSVSKLAAAEAICKEIVIVPSATSNVLSIAYKDKSIERGLDILNGLIQIYKRIIVEEKAQSFTQSIHFIEERIIPLGKDLDSIETANANYKSSKGYIGNGTKGPEYLAKVALYQQKLDDINNMKSVIASVEQFINNPKIKLEQTAATEIQFGTFQANISQYRQLLNEIDKLSLVATENNANLQFLQKRIAEIRNNIGLELRTYKMKLLALEFENGEKFNEANLLLKATPMEEKLIVDKARMQNIKEALFLNLLQKREEASIAKAAITVNVKIIAPPNRILSSETPLRSKIIFGCILFGLILPVIIVLIKELLNNKIISKKQLQKMSKLPVLGELEEIAAANQEGFAINENERSMFGEQIRTLRTSLNFYASQQKSCTFIMITSSMSGEGKSFLSMNLARSYSLQGKKVALLEFDLRRPKLSKAFGISRKLPGLSSVLIGQSEMKDIVQHSNLLEASEHFHFYPSGAVPPNPQELIGGTYMQGVKKYLDENYDVVVIDTPPFGIVADAQLLGTWADVTLIMARFQLTITEQVREINEWKDRGAFKNMAFIINGVKNSGYYGSKYGYYKYKRKYGYKYYSSIKE